MLSDAKKKYEWNLASKSKTDPKLIYSYIRGKMCVKENVKALRTGENLTTTDREAITNELNNQFKSVFVHEPEAQLPEFEKELIWFLQLTAFYRQ